MSGLAIFLAYLVPPSILFIPLAAIIFKLGLYDSDWALILTYPTFLMPFCTWLLMGYFRTIPYELEECAMIDGASRLQILRSITLPLALPGLISAGIFAFTLSWNEFIYALTFISSSENKTVPVGAITELVEGDVYHWGSLMAAALLGSLPVVIFYSFFVEHYVASLTGAVKECRASPSEVTPAAAGLVRYDAMAAPTSVARHGVGWRSYFWRGAALSCRGFPQGPRKSCHHTIADTSYNCRLIDAALGGILSAHSSIWQGVKDVLEHT